jgi:hypothetical protein
VDNKIEKIIKEYIREQIKCSDAKTAKENINEIYLSAVKSFERHRNVVVIKASGEIIHTKMRINNLEDFKQAVGGKCRPVPIGDYGICFVNDDGLNIDLNLRVNKLATIIYQKVAQSFYDHIVGDAVYIGYADEDGEYVDIPEKFVELIEEVSNVKLKPTKVEPVVFTEEEKFF